MGCVSEGGKRHSAGQPVKCGYRAAGEARMPEAANELSMRAGIPFQGTRRKPAPTDGIATSVYVGVVFDRRNIE